MKIMDLIELDHMWSYIQNEIAILWKASHPNVVQLFSSFLHRHYLWMVMPFNSTGSIRCAIDYITDKRGFSSEKVIATILRQVLLGLNYLHRDGHVHRDIKTDNILISDQGNIQLADFGVAATLDSMTDIDGLAGTPCWIAPEVILSDGRDAEYSSKADIWSLGVMCIELANGRAPLEEKGYGRLDILKQILTNPAPALPDGRTQKNVFKPWSSEFHDFVSQCLVKDPVARSTASALLTHPFLDKAKKASYLVKHIISHTEELGSKASLSWRQLFWANSPLLPEISLGVEESSWNFSQVSELKSLKPVPGRSCSYTPRGHSLSQVGSPSLQSQKAVENAIRVAPYDGELQQPGTEAQSHNSQARKLPSPRHVKFPLKHFIRNQFARQRSRQTPASGKKTGAPIRAKTVASPCPTKRSQARRRKKQNHKTEIFALSSLSSSHVRYSNHRPLSADFFNPPSPSNPISSPRNLFDATATL